MKRISAITIFIFIMLTAVAAFAQSGGAKPKIAVYVTSNRDAHRALADLLLEAFVNSKRYTAVERSGAFIAMVDREQRTQRSGAIDEQQISRLGMQSGVQFVCVVDVIPISGSNQITARIIDVESADVTSMSVTHGSLLDVHDLKAVSRNLVEAILGDAHKRYTNLAPGEVYSPPTPEYALTINIEPTGGGTVSRDPDLPRYKAGTRVTTTAIPANGYTFAGWSGGINISTPKVTGPMNRDLTLTANFQVIPPSRESQITYTGELLFYEEFTADERWKTWFRNWLIPGLGSGTVMGDKAGAWTLALLTVGGVILMIADEPGDGGDGSKPSIGTTGTIGLSMAIGGGVFNIIRSITYKKPVYDTDTGKKPRKSKAPPLK